MLLALAQGIAADPHGEIEDGMCCINIIDNGIRMLTEFNSCVHERGDCRICCDGFKATSPSGSGTHDYINNGKTVANNNSSSTAVTTVLENAATCPSCRSMFHGSCLSEHWWRFNVRRAMRSFSGSNSASRDFYFEIGEQLRKLENDVAIGHSRVAHAEFAVQVRFAAFVHAGCDMRS